MRTAVLAATLAFTAPLSRGPFPFAARKLGSALMALLDHRRKRIDGE